MARSDLWSDLWLLGFVLLFLVIAAFVAPPLYAALAFFTGDWFFGIAALAAWAVLLRFRRPILCWTLEGILSRGGHLQFELPRRTDGSRPLTGQAPGSDDEEAGGLSLDELVVRERVIVSKAIERTRGKIYGSDGAAALLRIRPTTLVSKMKRLGVQRETR